MGHIARYDPIWGGPVVMPISTPLRGWVPQKRTVGTSPWGGTPLGTFFRGGSWGTPPRKGTFSQGGMSCQSKAKPSGGGRGLNSANATKFCPTLILLQTRAGDCFRSPRPHHLILVRVSIVLPHRQPCSHGRPPTLSGRPPGAPTGILGAHRHPLVPTLLHSI